MASWLITNANETHIPAIAANMRESDRREIWASHRHTPAQALANGLARAEMAWTCLVDGVPSFMWGVARHGSIMSTKGAPWLLGTPDIFKVQREFVRQCRSYVTVMQEIFPLLENFVHAENHASVRWLKWCGFTIDEDIPELINDEDFFRFWRER